MTTDRINFEALNRYFDHVYIITLDHAQARQTNIKQQLQGLQYSFFAGTDKKHLDLQTLVDTGVYDDALHRQTKRTHRSMTLAEIACALSHKRIYQDMLANNYQRVLIMEDDVLPQAARLAEFDTVIQQLPENWELLMLGYYDDKPPTAKYRLQQSVYTLFHHLHLFNWHKVSKRYIEQLCMRDYSRDWFEIGKVLGAHAYAVNRTAAEKFIHYQTPIRLQADRIFNYYKAAHGLNAYACKDTMFTLSELSQDSYIQNDR